ncbi:MAG: DNA mismatch repair protein MutS [Bacteroidales bacterium]|nr:DNA mismatch repair protein MutS [Bacteroidales bacterium]
MGEKKIVETPLMKQFFAVKAQHPEAILLFRVGDFYETFGDDAVVASKVLGIVLTKRANGSAQHVELAGFPHHSIDTYLPKLVRAGYKVAVCDQLEDPKLTKKIVRRGVTELVTPGVVYNEQLLPQKENNFLASVCFEKDKGGVAFLDISTGTFRVAEGSMNYIDLLLTNMAPKEILVERGYAKGFRERFQTNAYISTLDEWAFVYETSYEKLKKHFGLDSLKGFGVEGMNLSLTAAGAILYYLENNQQAHCEYFPTRGLSHLCSISRIDSDDFVWLDRFTVRNLELIYPSTPDGVSLLGTIDRCASPMGGRLLRHWVSMPSKHLEEIRARHEVVEDFTLHTEVMDTVREKISEMGDMERIISRAAGGRISPREVAQLRRGLSQILPLKLELSKLAKKESIDLRESLEDCTEILKILNTRLAETPASQIGKGEVIARGVSQELDQLRDIAQNSKDILNGIQEREQERTGISSLKISYNNVFGYYLEVRNTHKDKVPSDWIRKQTLVSAERYITPELKEYEEKILGAEERIYLLESNLYSELVASIQHNIPLIQRDCAVVAKVDCLASFASLAIDCSYCKPQMDDSDVISITQGRHPVIERLMEEGEQYVANDLYLDKSKQQIIILTGPNMAGKSALLRQTALIVLMAQIGSFVPASAATIGYVDKIFTRVGASDNISRGESTFMVEMLETATILHNLSPRSLVLLDEIGRGTSTFDGMSIAWAIVEYIHQRGQGAKTLFATHYHELNELEEKFDRVRNFHISVKEADGKVLFLRKLTPGGVAHSFGIHVARLAGMPREVVDSAQKLLRKLEEGGPTSKPRVQDVEEPLQLSIFQLDDPILVDVRDTLRGMDLNSMSPLDAFDLLRELKKKIGL